MANEFWVKNDAGTHKNITEWWVKNDAGVLKKVTEAWVKNDAGVARQFFSSGFNFTDTITSNNATEYNLSDEMITAGWNESDPVVATVTVNSGVYMYPTSVSEFAFTTGIAMPAGSSITLTNNGKIYGFGGQGAGGQFGFGGSNGSDGGNAIKAFSAITINNNSGATVAGGGGGGGGGAGQFEPPQTGGGGGGGAPLGLGAQFVPGTPPATDGTVTTGGTGGGGDVNDGGDGGNPGLVGSNASPTGSNGGGVGNYIIGDSFVTWTGTGDKLGGAVS